MAAAGLTCPGATPYHALSAMSRRPAPTGCGRPLPASGAGAQTVCTFLAGSGPAAVGTVWSCAGPQAVASPGGLDTGHSVDRLPHSDTSKPYFHTRRVRAGAARLCCAGDDVHIAATSALRLPAPRRPWLLPDPNQRPTPSHPAIAPATGESIGMS